jgi:hypothetical protein
MKRRLVYFLCIFACLAGLLLPGIGLAQIEDDGATTTSTPSEVIPEQDMPGDTTVLFFAAVVLVLIAIGGVIWRNSIMSRGDTKPENSNGEKNL